jgi:alpha-beta hydrolase superfamily lysophospholipase
LCHGIASDHRQMVPSALRLVERGFAALVFDFRGHGRSGGVADGDMDADVKAAVEAMMEDPELRNKPLAVVGHSIGARAAIVGTQDIPLKAAVLLAAPDDELFEQGEAALPEQFHKVHSLPGFVAFPGRPLWQGLLGSAKMLLQGRRMVIHWGKAVAGWMRNRASVALGRSLPRAYLFVHCKGDSVVPYGASQRLYALAPEPKAIYLAEGGYHSTPLWPGRVRRAWMGWLDEVMR